MTPHPWRDIAALQAQLAELLAIPQIALLLDEHRARVAASHAAASAERTATARRSSDDDECRAATDADPWVTVRRPPLEAAWYAPWERTARRSELDDATIVQQIADGRLEMVVLPPNEQLARERAARGLR